MKTLISGHRKHKLVGYDTDWIQQVICDLVRSNPGMIGLSGMADGIDLMFCRALLENNAGYHCYIPFDEQDQYMSSEDKQLRYDLIKSAWSVIKARNSQMVSDCQNGIIVWDGNKGGTHNVLQQMVEYGKRFWWIEPKNKRIINF